MKYLEIIKKFIINNKIALICGVGLFGIVALYPVDYAKESELFKAKIEEVEKEIDKYNKNLDENELKNLVQEIESMREQTEELKKQ